MSESGNLPRATEAEKVTDNKYRNYYNMIKYVDNIYNTLNSNEKNEFKQFYLECEEVEYDQQTGRVMTMKFRQLKVNAST